ncbi:uncharacterized protein LOC132759869 isoform X2 [Ruditapes philippinarum]|uniref:uncharacterized protein LOC132759869 isoform X2 n=1 Tax=Ruditapes philippinarum TaxID=129788 RepID=UPI00295AE4E9|nr:uncharacterized protein LOC132759869 isoform X2 [Ruditapes philippinarum]
MSIISTPTRTSSQHWACSGHFRYNQCHDPVHPGNTLGVTEFTISFQRNLRRITRHLIDEIENKTTEFETEIIRCDNIVLRLQQESLTNILGLHDADNFHSENSFTNMYLKMTDFLHLYNKIWCLFASKAVDECCIPFEQLHHRIKHRLLSKWWIVQESFGQVMDQQHCETSVVNFRNTELRCEDIRNTVYILLRNAHSLLDESLSVIDLI